MPDAEHSTQLLGEIKGRLDTYIVMMERDHKLLWSKVDNHEDRLTTLEADVEGARSIISFIKWAVGGVSVAIGFLFNHFWSHPLK